MTENRIDATLGSLRSAGKTALVPFITVGFPDIEMSEALAEAIAGSGADMLELGVPFSDPLADGPTIQMTSFRALENGVNVHASLDLLSRLRANGIDAPLIFMGYYNPFLQFGTDCLAAAAEEAGLDGVIVPDLPTEEAGPFGETCARHGIYLIPLLAPTSTDQRIEWACSQANGFIYCVSLAGVTGARDQVSDEGRVLVERVRGYTDLPVAVGFGLSRPEHIEQVGRYADAAVVGSALVNVIDQAPIGQAVAQAALYLSGLREAAGSSNRGAA